MNQNRPQRSIISTGTTSIVLIFVMLCMLTFSVLSLTSAQANLRLSRKSAERTQAYYEAENAANDVLLEILDDMRGDTELPEGGHVAYQVPVGEDQVLDVELTLYPDGQEGAPYRIDRWQVESRYDWSSDEPLHLMGADNMPTG